MASVTEEKSAVDMEKGEELGKAEAGNTNDG